MIVTRTMMFVMLFAAPATAVPLTTLPVPLDPAKAYIVVEYKSVPNPWAKSPLAPKYLPQMGGLTLARYDNVHGDVRGMGKAAANAVPLKQAAAERFQNRPLVKTETARLFVFEVEPDTWVVQGWGDTSFSLGSYSFVLAAGQVVDLGIVTGATDWGADYKPGKTSDVFKAILLGPFAKAPPVAPLRVSFRLRGDGDIVLPAGLVATPVNFTNGATFGNYLGGPVNRIEGVNTIPR